MEKQQRKSGNGTKPKTRPTEKEEHELRKPKKYHEQCFDSENKPTEKRIRYRDDEVIEYHKEKRKQRDKKDKRHVAETECDNKSRHRNEKNEVLEEKICSNEKGNETRKKNSQGGKGKQTESANGEKVKSCRSGSERSKDVRLKRKPRVEDADYEGVGESEMRSGCSKSLRRRDRNEKDDGESKHHQRRRSSALQESNVKEDKKERRKERLKSDGVKAAERVFHRSVSENQTVESRNKQSRRRADEKSHKRACSKKTKERRDKYDRYEDTRKYHSDSEVDQTRTNISACANDRKADSADNEKVVNIGELYDYFYREETKGRRAKNDDVPKRRGSTPSETPIEGGGAEDEKVEGKQSTIRGKLIRVLFKRVKDLLKETETLRDERKEFMSQIEALSKQVAGLRLKEEEHLTTELRIKERLNSIATGIHVSEKGTSFRDEIQSILNDIQTKYVTYWQTHEQNLQRVQSQAEDKIQSLMSSVVGKYMKMNEMQTDPSTAPVPINTQSFTDSHILSDKHTKFGYTGLPKNTELKDHGHSGRLLDSTEPTTEYSFTFSNSNSTGETVLQNTNIPNTNYMRLTTDTNKDIDTLTTRSILENPQNKALEQQANGLQNTNDFPLRYMKPLYVDTGSQQQSSFPNTGKNGHNLLRIAAPKSSILADQNVSKVQSINKQMGERNPRLNQDNILQKSEQQHIETSNGQDIQKTKDELKEFWRHKLLQPNPLQTIRKEREESDHKYSIGQRNQY
eukprot:TCONS_00013286-protein